MSQEDDGDRGCRLFRRLHEDGGPSHDQVHLEPDQFGREFWKPSGVALGRPELNQNVLALDPAALPQADRKACHRRASAGSEALFVKIPTRYTFPACCASAPTGAVRRPPATLPSNALLEITDVMRTVLQRC